MAKVHCSLGSERMLGHSFPSRSLLTEIYTGFDNRELDVRRVTASELLKLYDSAFGLYDGRVLRPSHIINIANALFKSGSSSVADPDPGPLTVAYRAYEDLADQLGVGNKINGNSSQFGRFLAYLCDIYPSTEGKAMEALRNALDKIDLDLAFDGHYKNTFYSTSTWAGSQLVKNGRFFNGPFLRKDSYLLENKDGKFVNPTLPEFILGLAYLVASNVHVYNINLELENIVNTFIETEGLFGAHVEDPIKFNGSECFIVANFRNIASSDVEQFAFMFEMLNTMSSIGCTVIINGIPFVDVCNACNVVTAIDLQEIRLHSWVTRALDVVPKLIDGVNPSTDVYTVSSFVGAAIRDTNEVATIVKLPCNDIGSVADLLGSVEAQVKKMAVFKRNNINFDDINLSRDRLKRFGAGIQTPEQVKEGYTYE